MHGGAGTGTGGGGPGGTGTPGSGAGGWLGAPLESCPSDPAHPLVPLAVTLPASAVEVLIIYFDLIDLSSFSEGRGL